MTRFDFAPHSPPISKTTSSPRTTPKTSHAPTRSSPLSRSRNSVSTLRGDLNMLPSPPASPLSFLTPKRLFKPTFPSREECREMRRNQFLKKVRDGRDKKLAKCRGGDDEMMRTIFVSEKRSWEAAQARAAARIPTIYEDVELEAGTEEHDFLGGAFSYDHENGAHYQEILEEFDREVNDSAEVPAYTIPPSEDIEEVMNREGRELEALLSQLELDQVMGNGPMPEQPSENASSNVHTCPACGDEGVAFHESIAGCMNCGFFSH